MEEKRISEQESLLIIQQMIQSAKQEQRDNGLGWIIWGWLVFSASLLTWFNLKYDWFSNYFFWNMFGILGGLMMLYTIFSNFFFKKRQKVRTYTGDLFKQLDVGFFIVLALIILSMNLGVSPVKGFALLTGLIGFWILIYGTALNFKPSIAGAYITWAISFVALFLRENQFDITMLLQALSALAGYIIPGHIANKEFKKINRSLSV
ncbi:MAG TPA: hypothetical protein VFO70_03710 [Chitinophagaceae bacterium]|nr:hypothetical protein [Chitinophagaceae bacterium]